MSPFQRLLHADWSLQGRKRRVAEATREGGGWRLSIPVTPGDTSIWTAALMVPDQPPTLVGFDFPIGVPARWARRAGLERFDTLLAAMGQGRWVDFDTVADSAADVALERPFFPRRGLVGVRRRQLVEALGLDDFDDLYRHCERTITGRRPTPLFWTLGAAQVGKAALSGWREVIAPARRAGAALWPFDGTLSTLAGGGRPVLAESWPSLAARRLGVALKPGQSKRCQADRAAVGRALLALDLPITFDADLAREMVAGFGPSPAREDDFDALLGLVLMVAIVEGRMGAEPGLNDPQRLLEGWILGLET
ncbi:DUF429 domain-containing protein [Kushneria aurantia]|uniref:DUF429 domain-containing protein n=1 Tax=Kushneria aurantia TaxID=504092 RepID=A0ABV6G8P5_9GAMM|nr:DUF429 domain-containing protein [Kushneria aurantia]